jgi:hypothetical protein
LADINFLAGVAGQPGFKNLASLWPGSYLEPTPKHSIRPEAGTGAAVIHPLADEYRFPVFKVEFNFT